MTATASAQKVSLKNEGIKGILTTASCTLPLLGACLVTNAPADEFLYIRQACFTENANTTTNAIPLAGGVSFASALLTPLETKCFSFDPAFLVQKGDGVGCLHGGFVGSANATCTITGVISSK